MTARQPHPPLGEGARVVRRLSSDLASGAGEHEPDLG